VAGYQTAGAGYQTAGAGYQTAVAGYQTAVAGYQTAHVFRNELQWQVTKLRDVREFRHAYEKCALRNQLQWQVSKLHILHPCHATLPDSLAEILVLITGRRPAGLQAFLRP
jgi:hypothetical protein